MEKSGSLHRWVVGSMVAVIICSIAAWYITHDRVPRTIRLATGEPGGLYHSCGEELDQVSGEDGPRIEVLDTTGTLDNRKLLLDHGAHAAILQGDAIPHDGIAFIAPVFAEVVHLVVRKDAGIETMDDLYRKTIAVGPAGSGMQASAYAILNHYGLKGNQVNLSSEYFLKLLDDESIDAAFVTTGVMNPDLQKLMLTGRFVLLPIPGAAAIEIKNPFLRRATIPRGLYHERPAIPPDDIETLSTTALLAVRDDASPVLITALLKALHERGLSMRFPALIPHHEAEAASPVTLHPAARVYFNPPDQITLMSNIVQSLAATKELILALGAFGWLLWDRWRRRLRREHEEVVRLQRELLDDYLEKTLQIEEAHLKTDDPERLERLLNVVTKIKLKALGRLTDASVRSDNTYSLFVSQCANLINKIQFRIGQCQAKNGESKEEKQAEPEAKKSRAKAPAKKSSPRKSPKAPANTKAKRKTPAKKAKS